MALTQGQSQGFDNQTHLVVTHEVTCHVKLIGWTTRSAMAHVGNHGTWALPRGSNAQMDRHAVSKLINNKEFVSTKA